MARQQRARGGRWRPFVTYGVILLAGAGGTAIVLPIGDGIEAAPQAPSVGAVQGDATRCLGERLAIEQSGIYVTFLTAEAGEAGPEKLGSQIGTGRIGRTTGEGTITGTCAPGTPREGERFSWAVRFLVEEADEARIEGLVTVGPDRLAAVVAAEEPADAPVAARGLEGNELVGRTFLAVAVVIVVARALGGLFGRIRQPRVVGEIVAGILLGPSLLGAWFPDATRYLFSPEVTGFLRILAQFGLILFMFIVGLELNHRLLKGSGHVAVLISHVSIVVPFTLGLFVSLLLYPVLGGGRFSGFALFMGAAMAITAFPVLARILTDTGLHRTRLGAVAITCAAVDDVTAWCVLAVDVAVVKASGGGEAVRTIALSMLFLAGMIFVVRPLVARLATAHEARGHLTPPVLAGILAGLLLSAWATEEIGIHAIFGAFLAGAVMPRSKALVREITGKLEDITVLFLLPVFFAVVGLSTRFDLLTRPELWLLAALVIAVAVVGKFGGTLLASRAAHEGWRFSAGLGVLMNTRGLTEIVILTVGRSLGVISPLLFTVMVLMALTTTFMATPLLTVLYPPDRIEREARRAARHVGSGPDGRAGTPGPNSGPATMTGQPAGQTMGPRPTEDA